MGWKGLVRSMAAAERRAARSQMVQQRQAERASARLRKQLIQQHQAMQAADERMRAHHAYQMFENYIDVIQSLHKEGWTVWNWPAVAAAPAPVRGNAWESAAQARLQGYKPSIVDRTLGKDKQVRAQLEAELPGARAKDEQQYQHDYAVWDWHRTLAQSVVSGDLNAYGTVIEHICTFDELEELGNTVTVGAPDPSRAEAHLYVRDAEIVPTEELKLLASGKLSTKTMPKGRYWALYQDYVCSAVLRVARDLFALLPLNTVRVHVFSPAIDSATGHNAQTAILSVEFPRDQLWQLNFERLDPSDAVESFTHRMKFKKTSGFQPVELIGDHQELRSH